METTKEYLIKVFQENNLVDKFRVLAEDKEMSIRMANQKIRIKNYHHSIVKMILEVESTLLT